MINLIGSYECKVDAKARLMFPVAFKKQLAAVLNEGFVLKRSVFHKCLELYPMSVWNKELERVSKLNRFVKKNNDFIRMYTAGVQVVELDATGRLLIPIELVKFSSITKDVVLSSSINRIEIWDKALYESVINDESIDFGQLAEDVMGNFINSEDNE